MTLLLIAAAGGAEAAARFILDGLIGTWFSAVFPAATVTINITGSLALGVLTAAAASSGLGEPWTAAFSIGFCAGCTTFSTAMVETVRLIQAGNYGRAALNAVATVAAAAGGLLLGQAIW